VRSSKKTQFPSLDCTEEKDPIFVSRPGPFSPFRLKAFSDPPSANLSRLAGGGESFSLVRIFRLDGQVSLQAYSPQEPFPPDEGSSLV